MMYVYLAVLARSGMVLIAFPFATKTVATSAKMGNVFTNAVTAKNAKMGNVFPNAVTAKNA